MDTRTSEREAQATGWTGATANMQSELETAMQEVLRMQQADPVTPDTYDLVVHPSMLWNLFLETLLPHFDARQLLGLDGRGSGERWITLSNLSERPLRAEALSLKWDPRLPGGLASCEWDDTGLKTSTLPFLETGGIVKYLPVSPDLVAYDDSYALGFPGFNFSRAPAWHTPATVAMPNMVLEGGPGKNLNDLIAGVDNGIFVKGRGTVMTNPAKSLFRVRPQAAWIIRGGKIAEMVRDVEIETSTEQFWNAMEEAGRTEDTFLGGELFPRRAYPLWDTPFTVATPPALFRRIPVYRTEGQS
jgi:TldD protein